MKTTTTFYSSLIIILCLLVLPASLKAQDLTPPKDGAAIRMISNQISVDAGVEKSVEVYLIKSKRYQKQTFGGLDTSAPEGITISFSPVKDRPDVYSMTILASKSVKEGKYTLMLKGTGNNRHKVKSSVISLTVENKAMVHN